MAQDYNRYLAAAVFNDGRVISYRLLSRELKVHANVAKRMLFDFHHTQNVKKPGSVHATYLLEGTPKPFANEIKANGYHTQDDDVPMQSSPFTSSAVQQEDKVAEVAIPVKSVILAREEDIQAAKESFDILQSAHVYSLQPNTLHNLQSLSDCNRTISSTFNSEDPLVVGQQYGVIQNSKVRRRMARRPLGVAPSAAAAATEAQKVKLRPTSKDVDIGQTESKTAGRSSQDSVANSEGKSVSRPSNKAANKMPALKKEKSDIFKSFSKPKSTLKREPTDSSAVESSAPASQGSVGTGEDQQVKDTSDGEQEEDGFVLENKADPGAHNARSQRAEQLRKMMDEDDEEMDDTPEKEAAPEDGQDTTAVVEESVTATTQEDPTPEPASQMESAGGRRRGRRKVMKKKTTKDEEGYLVTREEPAWESFSEDEPGPSKERAPASSAAGSKAKKVGGARPGQGNIMSFFGKK